MKDGEILGETTMYVSSVDCDQLEIINNFSYRYKRI